MTYHDLSDFMVPGEYQALRRKHGKLSVWFVVLAAVVVVLFIVAEIFFSPTTKYAESVHQDNAYYCAHLSEYRMLDGDRAKIERYCASI